MPQPSPPPRIFDRALVNRRLDRAWARRAPARRRISCSPGRPQDLGERLSLVKRRFAIAADFGSPGPHGAAALAAGGQADCVIRLAPTEASLGAGDFLPAVGDLERLPAADGRLDLAVSLLALQTVNDLPGALVQMRRALKARRPPDRGDDRRRHADRTSPEPDDRGERDSRRRLAARRALRGRARARRPRATGGPGAAGRRPRPRDRRATPTCSR